MISNTITAATITPATEPIQALLEESLVEDTSPNVGVGVPASVGVGDGAGVSVTWGEGVAVGGVGVTITVGGGVVSPGVACRERLEDISS